MRKKLVYCCEKCGHLAFEKKTILGRIRKVSKFILIAFFAVMSLLGTCAFYNFVIGKVYDNPNIMISLGGFWATTHNFAVSFQSNGDKEQLRNIALNLTEGCSQYPHEEIKDCQARKIFEYLVINFPFEKGEDLIPLKIWEDKKGDCDELSYLYLSLLHQLDISAMMQCTQTHCWNIIHLEDKTIRSDIVGSSWEEF